MIIEAREDVVQLEGALDKNLWPTIQAAANLLLRQHPQGIIVDGSSLTACSPEGAQTFREAMDYIERYRARIVVSAVPEGIIEVIRAVPGIRSRLPIAATVEEARASLRLARPGAAQGGSTHRALQDILVPLLRADTPETSTMLACRLAKAGEQKARLHLAYILEVPRHLPLSSPLPEEEAVAAEALVAAQSWVQREGLLAVPHVLRARDAGEEIVHQAGILASNMIVLSRCPSSADADEFMTRVMRTVIDRAPCEVILNKLPEACI